jgi:dihydrofolate reductase
VDISYYVAMSLDGFIADSKGSVDWLSPFEGTGEDYGYTEFYASVDALLMGRRTYDFCRALPAWPYAGKPAWVFTHGTLGALPPDTVATAEPPAAVAGLLRSRGCRHAWLVGGGELASAFRAEGLISRYIVSVIPVILGGGAPLLAAVGGADRLDLVGHRPYDSGIVQLEYRVAAQQTCRP